MAEDSSSRTSREERLEQVLAEYLASINSEQPLDRDALVAKHPEFAGDLRSFFRNHDAMQRMAEPLRADGSTSADEVTVGLTGLPLDGSSRVRYFGDYELLDEIARGGMGVVYKARQVSLNRTVAVKMILAGQLAGEEDVKRFRAEAEAAARLDHPCIVPIYEIGQQAGQHYFSMALVDGESLADRVARGVVSPKEAAALLLKVARAIAFAHAAGVVHRDLKPANILIDRAGEPHVTDFGLAKQLHAPLPPGVSDLQPQRSNLTGTGQILGTPSYMAPEQAAGKGQLIGPPADIYSLGSVLYCLVTGRPPFQTASPVDTLLQVIHDEPASPRLLNPSLPRDLETICLKCLDKEPRRRYSSAKELADELERFLHDEPILARPPDLAERAWRWLRKQRRSVALTAGAVAATFVLSMVGVAGWFWYQEWRLGRMMLNTDRPPIVAELLNDAGEAAGPSFTVPTQEPMAIPAGDYRLRLSSVGRMTQEFETTVQRGVFPATYSANLEDQLLGIAKNGGTEFRVDKSYALITRGNHTGVVLLNANGIEHTTWYESTLPLDKSAENPAFKDAPGLRWPWYTNSSNPEHAQIVFHPQVMRDAPDVDEDGIRDVIIAARHQAWVMAVSVSKGTVLWLAARGKDVSTAPAASALRNPSAALTAPLAVPDRDADGVADLLVMFADDGQRVGDGTAPRRWAECLSGKTGKSIWNFDFEPQWFALPAGEEHPHAAQWFLSVYGWSSGGGSWSDNRGEITRDLGSERLSGEHHAAPFPLTLIGSKDRQVAVTTAGSHAIGIDLATGKMAWPPLDLGQPLMTRPRFANVSGDEELEMLVVQPVPGKTDLNPNNSKVPVENRELAIAAWSLGEEGKQLWEHTILAERRPPWKITSPEFPWPVAEDLDGDGHAEVIVPNRHFDRSRGRWSPEVEALDGTTGKSRWRRGLKNMDSQIDLFIAGPDVNGDGARDVFAAAMIGNKYDVYVDAVSGNDGQTVWWSKQTGARESYLDRLSWWHTGRDGWPRLLVTTAPSSRDSNLPQLFLLSAATGELASRVSGIDQLELADADGDGLTDLFTFQRAQPNFASKGGRLQAIRGLAGEKWRRLGGNWQPGADYDGDGLADLATTFPSGTPQVAAISSRDGRQIWRTTLLFGPTAYNPSVQPLSIDLNDDQVNDLIVYRGTTGGGSSGPIDRFPVAAVSGKTGAVLWMLEMKHGSTEGMMFIEVRDLENDGTPELIFSTFTDWDYVRGVMSNSSAWSQHWLAVVNARTGRFKWRKPLSVAYGAPGVSANHSDDTKSADVHPAFADLNGDGVTDILMPAEVSKSPQVFELRATSGRDGATLWQRPFALPNDTQNSPPLDIRHFWQNAVTPAVADLDGDGKSEVIGLEYFFIPAQAGKLRQRQVRMFALDAATGKERWTWQSSVPEYSGQVQEYPKLQLAKPTPRVVARKGRTPLLALGLWTGLNKIQPGRIVVFDEAGKLVAERAVETQNEFKLWAHDIDRDGNDELIVLDGRPRVLQVSETKGKLELTAALDRPGGPGAGGSPYGIVDILPAVAGQPATIVRQSGSVVYGFSATTGQVLWTATGTQPPATVWNSDAASAQLLSAADGALPAVVFRWGDQMSACYTARRVTETGKWQNGFPSFYADAEPLPSARTPAAVSKSHAPDPRVFRRPSWSPDPGDRQEVMLRLVWGVVLAIVLLVVPGRTVYRMIEQRQWSVRTLLLLPLLVALMLCVLRLPMLPGIEPTYRPVSGFRWEAAVMGLPLIVFTQLLIALARQRRIRALGYWALACVVGALLTSIGAVVTESWRLSPGERLSLADWDLPVAYGFYATAWLAMIMVLVRAVVRLFRRAPARKVSHGG